MRSLLDPVERYPPQTMLAAPLGMYGEAGGLKTIGHVDAADIEVVVWCCMTGDWTGGVVVRDW